MEHHILIFLKNITVKYMQTTKRFKTISEYTKSLPKEKAKMISEITQIVKKEAPGAMPTISYNMPAFKLNGVLLYYQAHTNHIGLYPYPSALKEFKKETVKYKTAKGSIQFPLDKPLPTAIIRKIVKFRFKEKSVKK